MADLQKKQFRKILDATITLLKEKKTDKESLTAPIFLGIRDGEDLGLYLCRIIEHPDYKSLRDIVEETKDKNLKEQLERCKRDYAASTDDIMQIGNDGESTDSDRDSPSYTSSPVFSHPTAQATLGEYHKSKLSLSSSNNLKDRSQQHS